MHHTFGVGGTVYAYAQHKEDNLYKDIYIVIYGQSHFSQDFPLKMMPLLGSHLLS